MRSMRTRFGAHAFTLLEVVIAAALLAVLAAAAATTQARVHGPVAAALLEQLQCLSKADGFVFGHQLQVPESQLVVSAIS